LITKIETHANSKEKRYNDDLDTRAFTYRHIWRQFPCYSKH